MVSCGLGMAALALLLSVDAKAAVLARQCGAFGIVTYDPAVGPVAPEPPIPHGSALAWQCGAFGIVTYDPLPDPTAPQAHTYTTAVPVPYAWLAQYLGVAHDYEAYEASARATAANGRLSVADCYALGLDPGVATSDFRIVSFPMKADGTPDIANMAFDPPQENWKVSAPYTVMGAMGLNGPWATATTNTVYRFFKVEVVLP